MTIALRPEGEAAADRRARPPGRLAVNAARLLLFLERAWPAILPALAPPFLIVILGLFGVFEQTPIAVHWLALVAAAGATAYAIRRHARELRWPARREALARLERDGFVLHAPLQALEDRPFAAGAEESPLWRAHLDDMKRRAAEARLKGMRALADERDPYALRFGALGLLVVALVAAGPDRDARLAGLFSPSADLRGAMATVDLWIEPPAYTGKAPAFLMRAGETVAGAREQINAPEGARVIVQAGGARGIRLRHQTPDATIEAEGDGASGRQSLVLAESGVLHLRIGGAEGRWPIGVVHDDPPTAEFIEPPSTTDDARLALAVRVEDDYGVASAALHLRLDPEQKRPLDAPTLDETAIRETRIVELEGLAGSLGERRFDLDLQADPWAGLAVIGKLVVRDGAGKEGATAGTAFRLPQKPFFNPLARAVVEQRQTLAVAPEEWSRSGRSFDALTLAPEAFYEKPTDYLLMRTAFWRVMREGPEKEFDGAVAAFWPLALQLEDEALELARRRLEAAQNALMEALERGASDDEIQRLVEELREAMQQYVQALAESGQPMANGGEGGDPIDGGDLNEMLDAIRDLAQSGARNAARQALSDLQELLDNLRLSAGAGGQGEGQGGQGSGGAAGEAGELIGRQRDLANRSYERGQEQGAPGDDLAAEEGGIGRDLEDLLSRLEPGGPRDPNGEAGEALGQALDDMERAEEALRGGDFDSANTAMESAIENLREGAGALARAEQAREGERLGEGEGEGRGPAFDPLGRPTAAANGRGVDVPEDAGPQRARDVLNELRRRLSDGDRSEEEIKYLERLLDRF